MNVTFAVLTALTVDGVDYGINRKQIVCAALAALQDAISGNSAVVPEMRLIIPTPPTGTTFVYDSQDSRRVAMLAFNDAYFEHHVHAVIGPGRSSLCSTLSLLGAVYEMLILSHWCSSPYLSDTTEYPYFARTYTSDAVTAEVLPRVLIHFGWTSVVMLYSPTEQYSAAYAASLKDQLPLMGVALLGEGRVQERDPSSFPAALTTVRSSGANIVIAIITDIQQGELFVAAHDAALMQATIQAHPTPISHTLQPHMPRFHHLPHDSIVPSHPTPKQANPSHIHTHTQPTYTPTPCPPGPLRVDYARRPHSICRYKREPLCAAGTWNCRMEVLVGFGWMRGVLKPALSLSSPIPSPPLPLPSRPVSSRPVSSPPSPPHPIQPLCYLCSRRVSSTSTAPLLAPTGFSASQTRGPIARQVVVPMRHLTSPRILQSSAPHQ